MTSTRIRAAVCRAFGEPLIVEDPLLAAPRAGQVQVRVHASAICHSDIHFFDGAWGGWLPAVWGHEAAGIVEGIGDGVEGVAIGDHVVITLIKSCGGCRNCQAGASVGCTGELAAHLSPMSDTDGTTVGHGLGTAARAARVVVDRSQVVVIDADIDMAVASLLACGVITRVRAATKYRQDQTGRVGCGDRHGRCWSQRGARCPSVRSKNGQAVRNVILFPQDV